MTLARDLAWQNLDLMYRSSISHQFARYSLALNYESLPQDVVHQGKRCLLDALGCAIGAYDAPGRKICESTGEELGGPKEATAFGSGIRTSVLNATLINSFLVRFLDYNDIGGGGHNSDSIPPILAVSEREGVGGKQFLTALVISYELGARVRQSCSTRWEEKGWTPDVRGGLSMPPALGKLMGLNEDQIANAIGICASHSLPLAILDADKEECSMVKNLRFGFVSYNAILSCILAKKGFTGPIRIIEGQSGIREVLLKGDMDLEGMVDFSQWRILKTQHKYLCCNGTSAGHVSATLSLVKKHDLKPEDIAALRIKTCRHESKHTTSLPKKYPRSAENADHSAFYLNAIAIKERDISPESYDSKKFEDPVLLDLIERMTVEYGPGLPEWGYVGISEIITKDGRRFQERVDAPHGFGNEVLSDAELEEKFTKMAVKYMKPKQIQEILHTVWNVEKLADMGELARLTVPQGS
jgi:2-methylcitrate dehydratase